MNEEDDLTASEELDQIYNEAGPIIEKKRHERKIEERKQEQQQKEEEQERKLDDEAERRYQERLDREEQQLLTVEAANWAAMERAQDEFWAQVALDNEIENALWTPEAIAWVEKHGIRQLTAKELAARRAEVKRDKALRAVHDLQQELLQELKLNREEVYNLRNQVWQDAVEALPDLFDKVKDQEKEIRDLQDRISSLE